MKVKKGRNELPMDIRRSQVLQVRLRPSEIKELGKKAEANHLKLSTYVRMAAMKYKAKWRAEN